jgi:hypothetical protein
MTWTALFLIPSSRSRCNSRYLPVLDHFVKRGGMTSGDNTVNARVHASPRALVIAASLSWVPFTVWIFGPYPRPIVYGLVAAAIPMVPIFAGRRQVFRRICLIEGSILLVAGVCGFIVGLFVFLAAAILLVIAGFADPGAGRRRAHIAGAVGAVVVILAAVGFSVGIYTTYYTAPNLYVATITPGFDQQPDYSSITNPTGAGIGYGATGIEDLNVSEGTGPPIMTVAFSNALSGAGRQRLKQRILSIPGVTGVKLCQNRITFGCQTG